MCCNSPLQSYKSVAGLVDKGQDYHSSRVATYSTLNSLTFLIFYSFSYPLKSKKKKKIFFTLMVLTVSLLIWGLLLKERICSPREQILFVNNTPYEEGDELRLSHENTHPFPS